MAKVNMVNMAGEQAGEIELNENVFGIEINQYAVHAVVKNYLANQRQGTQSAKTRAEVRGGGRKPFKQKGTGRARAGTTRSPVWVGGGVVFAPKPRSYRYSLQKKLRRLALKSVLTSKVVENEIIVLDNMTFDAPKTKEMIQMLKNVNADRKVLIVLDDKNENIIKSAANIPGVTTTLVSTLNVYEILNHTSFIVTKESAQKIEEVYS